MTCVEPESVELLDPASPKENAPRTSKLFIVPGGQRRQADEVSQRVAEVLDFELMRGSMPA
jgi:hypothetical protein